MCNAGGDSHLFFFDIDLPQRLSSLCSDLDVIIFSSPPFPLMLITYRENQMDSSPVNEVVESQCQDVQFSFCILFLPARDCAAQRSTDVSSGFV